MPRIRELWFVHNDCMGLLCWLVSNAVLWYSNYVIVHVVLLPWLGWRLVGAVNFCAFETVVLLAFVSLMRTTFTNPGTAARNTCTAEEYDAFRKEEELHGRHPGRKRLCGRCLCEKPYRTHHCSTCKACIIKMDHHCPWVNNCVGASNQKYFVLFLLYVLVGELYAITLLVIRGIGCLREADQCVYFDENALALVHCIVALVCSIFFVAFVCALLYDQTEAIWENMTYIESLQNFESDKRSFYANLCEVFGEPFHLRWLFPVPVPALHLPAVQREYARLGELHAHSVLHRAAPALPAADSSSDEHASWDFATSPRAGSMLDDPAMQEDMRWRAQQAAQRGVWASDSSDGELDSDWSDSELERTLAQRELTRRGVPR